MSGRRRPGAFSSSYQGGGLTRGEGRTGLSAEPALTSPARRSVSGLYTKLQDGLLMLPLSLTRKTAEIGAEIALNTWRNDLLSWKGLILAEKSSRRLSIE